MLNGIDWTPNELKKYEGPLKTIDSILARFAQAYGTSVYSSKYHGYLSREITFHSEKGRGNYRLQKAIYLILKQKKWPPKYDLELMARTMYGWKEVVQFIPVINSIFKARHLEFRRWKKLIRSFEGEINPQELERVLQEAKRLLDNLPEESLEPVVG